MLRHLYLLLDCSRWSRYKDAALNNKLLLEMTIGIGIEFVKEYYDQNPLGSLGVVLLRGGEAEMLTNLGGSPNRHILALNAALVSELKRGSGNNHNGKKGSDEDGIIGGEFSLQNGIEVAGRSLGYAPRYGSREILILTSALATCDPGDLLGETLPRLKAGGIRVSSVSMQAEMHVCKRLAEETGGLAGVCLDGRHLRDLVLGHAIPPPVSALSSERGGGDGDEANCGANGQQQQQQHELLCEFVTMGFPSKDGGDVPTLVHSTGGATAFGRNNAAFSINPAAVDDRRNNRLVAFARTGYVCPRCRSRCSDLPSDCAVCGLRLILAPHLARTFHHLFPVRPFEELDEAQVLTKTSDTDTNNGDATMSDANGEKINGARGLEALPVLSSSAFTPLASITSSASASFVVSSTNDSNSNLDIQQDISQANNHHTTKNSKIINIGPSLVAKSTDCDRCCFGCLKIIGCKPVPSSSFDEKNNRKGNISSGANTEVTESILRFQCPECKNVFCPDCDAFLHETLHNCPGCLCN
jgi:transcription initiation factor TFIIH subunit 2